MTNSLAIGAIAFALFATEVSTASEAKKESEARVSVFVGPRVRDGFVDVDSGIVDSIKDIQGQIRQSSKFSLVSSVTEAKIVLYVVGRRSPGDSGGVGVPIGLGMTVVVPIKQRAIDLLLKVGTYEKTITSEAAEGDDRWSSAAKRVVKDLTAWTDANRTALVDRK